MIGSCLDCGLDKRWRELDVDLKYHFEWNKNSCKYVGFLIKLNYHIRIQNHYHLLSSTRRAYKEESAG